MSKTEFKASRAFTIVSISILAGLAYGFWAAYANYEYGTKIMLLAGGAQGIYAFFSTWIVTSIAHKALLICGVTITGAVLSFCASLSAMIAIPSFVHWVINTPNVLQAVLPGLVWGSLYTLAYITNIRKSMILSQ